MQLGESRYFRDSLRSARARALADAEDFHDLLFTFERLGAHEARGPMKGLGGYKEHLARIARQSALFRDKRDSCGPGELPFMSLFSLVCEARNDAMHVGAFARHLTRHATLLALTLEDGLAQDLTTVGDFMVRDVIVAETWHSLGMVRQTMLASSFSHIPVQVDGEWRVVSDSALVFYVRDGDRKKRLAESVEAATKSRNGLQLGKPLVVDERTAVREVLKMQVDGLPILVISQKAGGTLIGLVTTFDLL